VLAGALLRCATLPYLSFHGDEAYTLRYSEMPASWILTHYVTGLTMHAYVLLMKVWGGWFGRSEIAFKLPSLIAGIALVPVLFLLARRLLDERTALVAAFLAAVDPQLVLSSRLARTYALLLLLAIVSMWAAHRAWSSPKGSAFVLLGFLNAVAITFSMNAVYLVATQSAWLLVEALLEKRERRRALFSGLFVAGFVAAALAFAFYAAILSDVDRFARGASGSTRPVYETLLGGLASLHPTASLVLLLVAVAGFWRVLQAGAGGRLIVLWAVLPCLVFAAMSPRVPIWAVGRYLLASLPAQLVVLAAGWIEIADRLARLGSLGRLAPARRGVVAASIAIVLAAGSLGSAWARHPSRFAPVLSEQRPIPPAVATISGLAEPRDLLVTGRDHERWIFEDRVPCPVLSLEDLLEMGEPVSTGRLLFVVDRDDAAEDEWRRSFRLHPVASEGWRDEIVVLESGSIAKPGAGSEAIQAFLRGTIVAARAKPIRMPYRQHGRLASLLDSLAALEAISGKAGRAKRHHAEALRQRELAEGHRREEI